MSKKWPYNEITFVALPRSVDDVTVGGHDVAGLAFRTDEGARVGPHLCRVPAADAVALESKTSCLSSLSRHTWPLVMAIWDAGTNL